MAVKAVAEQMDVPGTEPATDKQLEAVIREIKARNEAATEARNEVKKVRSRGTDLLKEKNLETYTSPKQGFTLVRNDKEDVKIVPYKPPRQQRVDEA